MRKVFILLVLLIFAAPVYATTVYKWVDEKGVVNFTDEYRNVPPAFRNRAEMEEYLEREPPPVLSQNAGAKIKGEVKTENYAMDYWKRQLDEATSSYEKARQQLLEAGEILIMHQYGSKTQFQMFTEELPSITERFETYKKQMIEARAMLVRFEDKNQEMEGANGKRAVSPKTDIYGRDETWWKEEVQPWKEQLKKATENYEKTFDEFAGQLERLGPFRWGGLSLTQYQMISSRLTVLSGRMEQDQTQISQAKGMLARLSKEARETKADPAWLE